MFKVNPPLRTDADVAAVRAGLADGTIDCIATDHAPHTQEAKEAPFDAAPPGMLGLETALALALTELDLPARRGAGPAVLAARRRSLGDEAHGGPDRAGPRRPTCGHRPRRPPGSSTRRPWPAAAATPRTPDATLRGAVRHTLLHGEPVVLDGEAQR